MYLLSIVIISILICIFVVLRKNNQLMELIIEGSEQDREIYIQTQKKQSNRKQQMIEQAKMRKLKMKN